MTFLASSAAALFGSVTLWTGRANNAWGASRQWNVGNSFETDNNNNSANAVTWQSRANQAWGASRAWSSGPSFESDAWSGGALNNGTLWRDAAHGDTNVWTNRYNAGVSAAQPAGLWNGAWGPGSNSYAGTQWRAWWELTPSSLVVPYNGQYAITGLAHCSYGSHNDDTDYVTIKFAVAGSSPSAPGADILQGPFTKRDGRGYGSQHIVDGVVHLAANTALRLYLFSDSPNAGPSTNWNEIYMRVRFIPTPAEPH